jgi:hypothetical protein
VGQCVYFSDREQGRVGVLSKSQTVLEGRSEGMVGWQRGVQRCGAMCMCGALCPCSLSTDSVCTLSDSVCTLPDSVCLLNLFAY